MVLRAFYAHQKGSFLVVCLFPLLFLLSLLYGLIVRTRAWFYRHHLKRVFHAPQKVVSVGNLTLGGTGKTPFVRYLAEFFLKQGQSPAIFLRGYGRRKPGSDEDYFVLGDEGAMLKDRLGQQVPVLAGSDRSKLFAGLRGQKDIRVVVLDDGFQHLRVARDMDIVLVDAAAGFGNGHLLPAGVLREPLKALMRAQVICLTRCGQVQEEEILFLEERLKDIAPGALLVRSDHEIESVEECASGRKETASFLKGKRVFAFSGIGRPLAFERTLGESGCAIAGHLVFPDHHDFTLEELQRLWQDAFKSGGDLLVTTEKDAARLKGRVLPVGLALFKLVVRLKITRNEEEFHARLGSLFIA